MRVWGQDRSEDLKVASTCIQKAATDDATAQAASVLERCVGAGPDGGVHPVARFAFFTPTELDLAEAKALADERVKIEALGEDIAAEGSRIRLELVDRLAHVVDDFFGDEGELPLIVFLMIEIAIPAQSTPRDALDLVASYDAIFEPFLPMSAGKIMPRRNPDGENFGVGWIWRRGPV